jgi:hypothetical protein
MLATKASRVAANELGKSPLTASYGRAKSRPLTRTSGWSPKMHSAVSNSDLLSFLDCRCLPILHSPGTKWNGREHPCIGRDVAGYGLIGGLQVLAGGPRHSAAKRDTKRPHSPKPAGSSGSKQQGAPARQIRTQFSFSFSSTRCEQQHTIPSPWLCSSRTHHTTRRHLV